MSMRRRQLFLLAGTAAVAGCSTAPYVPPLPPPEPIRLAVGQANVVPAFAVDAPPPGNFITARRQQHARERVQAILRSSLQAAGGDAYARLELIGADLVQQAIPSSGDAASRLGLEPASEFQLSLTADLIISDAAGIELGRAGAQVRRSSPIERGTSVRAEEDQVDQLVEEGSRLLIATLRASVRQQLFRWMA
jgi:hypothetical protein